MVDTKSVTEKNSRRECVRSPDSKKKARSETRV